MKIQEAVKKNRKIRIHAYSVSDAVEHRIKDVLEVIFASYDRPDLVPPVYTCLKELLMNAVKANFKNIFFEGYSPKNNPEEVINYDMALKLFKLEIGRENARHLERLAREADLKAEVVLQAKDDMLNINVCNPVAMTELEIANVHRKLEAARKYDDISEYFIDAEAAGNNTMDEGAGLGLIIISMMLRNLGVDEEDFNITSENQMTMASLKIPLKGETLIDQ
jgi:hypothetical protein